jgi:hypothetical protein
MSNDGGAPDAAKLAKGVATYFLLVVAPLAVNFGLLFQL